MKSERSGFNWGDLRLPNLPNEIFVALISSGLNLCCTYFIGAVNKNKNRIHSNYFFARPPMETYKLMRVPKILGMTTARIDNKF